MCVSTVVGKRLRKTQTDVHILLKERNQKHCLNLLEPYTDDEAQMKVSHSITSEISYSLDILVLTL